MPTFDINLWAVLLGGFVPMALGMFWYNPSILGTIWMKETGRSMSELENSKQNMGVTYLVAFIAALVTSYVLAHFIDLAAADTLGEGLQLALWIWLGIVLPVMLGSVLWDGRSVKYLAITSGYQLVSLVVVCAILALWQ